ncbi:type II secretion system minor pseudopilin GspI [Henriciella sp.]|uniref:type II secretion system minor pseudopilin GspI n=1 Tax=Henriciella sp. TaxID=1968823 RepID=UPI0026027E95|nr:type II secretion system minor pseudopilin GspI [Henriciella sp.]
MTPPADTNMRRSRKQAGFSLVETVAALGILSLAAVPLMQVSSEALQNTARLESRFLARTTAENVLSRAMADPEQVSAGQTSGTETQLGRNFNWTLTVYPTERPQLFRLEVTVSQTGRTQTIARLITLKSQVQPKSQPQSGLQLKDLTE